MTSFARQHWIALLLVVWGVLLMFGDGGPTFSANDSSWTVPGWLAGGVVVALAVGSLARSWFREEPDRRS